MSAGKAAPVVPDSAMVEIKARAHDAAADDGDGRLFGAGTGGGARGGHRSDTYDDRSTVVTIESGADCASLRPG